MSFNPQYKATPTTLAEGQFATGTIDSTGALRVNPNLGSTSNLVVQAPTPWSYAAATGGIDNSNTAVTIKAAGAAGVRNYVTEIQIAHATLGASTELAIRDGTAGTVLWRTLLHTTAMPTTSYKVHLMGTAATLLEVITLTAVTGDVLVNVQGYTGA